jgi:hypothetical protein
MRTVAVTEAVVQGAVSLERVGDVLRPWRLPHQRRHLFPSPGDSLMQKAMCTSGVRLRLETDADSLTLRFDPLAPTGPNTPNGHAFDAVIDN